MTHHIVVLGAGYTGAAAAGRLARRLHPDDTTITVVNAASDFVERVRLHQLATGQALAPRPLEQVFAGTGVRTRQAEVTGLDPDRRSVTITDAHGEHQLSYDSLVYALGSSWNTQQVPGVTDYAYDVAGRSGALRIRSRVDDLSPGQTVTVVGGGLTGLEMATELAEKRADLNISLVVRGTLGSWLSPRGQAHLRTVIDRLGISVLEEAEVTEVGQDHVIVDNRASHPADVTIWTTGFATHPIAAASTVHTAANGQIVVDATMRSVSHPDIYAIGDAAYAVGPGEKPLRMSCASGVPSAWQAADALAARLTDRAVPRVPIRYLNQCISLGRRDGLIQYVTADDRSRRAALTGRIASAYKEFVTKGAAWAVSNPTLGLPVRRRHVRTSVAQGDQIAVPA